MSIREIVKMKFGSHLYGTATENSDTDYKGVYLVPVVDVLLGDIPKSIKQDTNNSSFKNTPEDIDIEIYSLHYFIKLACEGQTVALDMLHAPLEFCEYYTPEWKLIVDNKEKFYTKNLKAFVGYARKQAAKYGVKGSRLSVMRQVIDKCRAYSHKTLPFKVIMQSLPVTEYSGFIEDSPNGIEQYEICGRVLQASGSIEYNLKIVQLMYEKYGERAKLAAKNEGIDWKALSHAFRAAYQVKELLITNTITFPRPESEFLLKVKQGKLDYLTEVEPLLNNLITEVEELSEKSTLPLKTDIKFWENLIVDLYCFNLKDYKKP